MLTITSIYAGLLGLMYLALTIRTIRGRLKNSVSIGDDGDKELGYRVRAHGNFAEYAPIGVVFLALIEIQGAPAIALHALGLCLFVGRLAHAYSFASYPPKMKPRQLGMMLTMTMLLASSLGLLAHAIF